MATQPLPAGRAGKYITFQIARHYFALEASRVRQVASARDMQPFEHPLPILRGVVVARGRRIPVVDVRERLGIKPGPSRPNSTIVVVDLPGVCGVPLVGVLVDRTTDVVELRDRDFHANVIQQRSDGRPYGRPKTLIEVETLFTGDELTAMRSIF